MPFETFIAGRYLRSRRKHAFISLITLLSIAGVTIGVMALVVVIAVMAGFETDLKSRILGIESHILVTRSESDLSDYRQLVSRITSDREIIEATPFVTAQVMVRSGTGVAGAVLRGSMPEALPDAITGVTGEQAADVFDRRSTPGRLDKAPGIILGKELARSIGVGPGETVYLISPRGILTPMGHVPAMKRFVVSGFLASGMYEYDGTLAFIAIGDAQKMLRMGDRVSGIDIRVRDIYRADRMAAELQDRLGGEYQVKDWMQMNHSLFSALKLEKAVMFIILTLIILVAAFNIASSLVMLVMKQKRDIGVLKAMGATQAAIRRIFVMKGVVIGLLGTTLGGTAGIFLCFMLEKYRFIELPDDVYYITTLPVQLDVLDVVAIAGAALVICFLATLYPAQQAAKVDPVEAIRYG
jgi:lipoprotein-releasing system permease protein